MVVCMDVSLLFSSDNNGCMYGCVIVVFECLQWLYEWMCRCCFRVTTMVVSMDVSLLFSSDNNGCMYGCVIVVFE